MSIVCVNLSKELDPKSKFIFCHVLWKTWSFKCHPCLSVAIMCPCKTHEKAIWPESWCYDLSALSLQEEPPQGSTIQVSGCPSNWCHGFSSH